MYILATSHFISSEGSAFLSAISMSQVQNSLSSHDISAKE